MINPGLQRALDERKAVKVGTDEDAKATALRMYGHFQLTDIARKVHRSEKTVRLWCTGMERASTDVPAAGDTWRHGLTKRLSSVEDVERLHARRGTKVKVLHEDGTVEFLTLTVMQRTMEKVR